MKGLSIPVGVNTSGSASTVKGDAQDQKIISIALSSDENHNAFQQDIGLGDIAVFKMADLRTQAEVLRRVRTIFTYFEDQHRFRLMEETVTWTKDSETQEMMLEFYYLNIESDETRPFQRSYSQA